MSAKKEQIEDRSLWQAWWAVLTRHISMKEILNCGLLGFMKPAAGRCSQNLATLLTPGISWDTIWGAVNSFLTRSPPKRADGRWSSGVGAAAAAWYRDGADEACSSLPVCWLYAGYALWVWWRSSMRCVDAGRLRRYVLEVLVPARKARRTPERLQTIPGNCGPIWATWRGAAGSGTQDGPRAGAGGNGVVLHTQRLRSNFYIWCQQ